MVCLAQTDAERWHDLFMHMMILFQSVAPPLKWEPELPEKASFPDVFDAWKESEATHHDDIWAAAHQLAAMKRLQSLSPEVHYFLHHRVCTALELLGGTFASRDGHPITIVPFPTGSVEEVAEWYLTEWADWHTANRLLDEKDFPDGRPGA